jgi:hypothetical protein
MQDPRAPSLPSACVVDYASQTSPAFRPWRRFTFDRWLPNTHRDHGSRGRNAVLPGGRHSLAPTRQQQRHPPPQQSISYAPNRFVHRRHHDAAPWHPCCRRVKFSRAGIGGPFTAASAATRYDAAARIAGRNPCRTVLTRAVAGVGSAGQADAGAVALRALGRAVEASAFPASCPERTSAPRHDRSGANRCFTAVRRFSGRGSLGHPSRTVLD